MSKPVKYSPEVRQRAVRMVLEHRHRHIPPAEAEAAYYRQQASQAKAA